MFQPPLSHSLLTVLLAKIPAGDPPVYGPGDPEGILYLTPSSSRLVYQQFCWTRESAGHIPTCAPEDQKRAQLPGTASTRTSHISPSITDITGTKQEMFQTVPKKTPTWPHTWIKPLQPQAESCRVHPGPWQDTYLSVPPEPDLQTSI